MPTDLPKEILASLRVHPLFAPCSEALLIRATKSCEFLTFSQGEELKSYGEKPFLCILRQGSALVYAKDLSTDLLLRILREGDTFGVATLFGDKEKSAITKIIAAESCQAICMREAAVRQLILNDSEFAMRYIDFLADRIRFLNDRITCLGANTAEEKVCSWLTHQLPRDGREVNFTLPMSYIRLADALGLGRASLYRVLDDLETRGLLTRNGKEIYIPCVSSLSAYTRSPH